MATFVLSLHAPPTQHDALQGLVRFAETCIDAGHTIAAVFVYQNAVWHGASTFSLAGDELDINAQWQRLKTAGIPLLLCVTAAEKRGMNLDDTGPFEVAGLAEFAMAASEADKWVQFK